MKKMLLVFVMGLLSLAGLSETITLVTAEGRDVNDPVTYAFYAKNVKTGTTGTMWSDELPPHADADYLVSGRATGQQYDYTDIWLNVGYATCEASGNDPFFSFKGKSLTLGERGRLVTPTHIDAANYSAYDIHIADLRFDSGSALWDGSWSGGIRTFANDCTITILASEEAPTIFWRDWTADKASQQSVASHFIFKNAFAGSGCLLFGGSGKSVNFPQIALHQVDILGNTEAFTGTIKVGEFGGLKNRYNNTVESNGSVIFALGKDGLKNGSLVFNSAESKLSMKANSKEKVQIKNLTLKTGGAILCVGMNNNAGKGFEVTGEFTIDGEGKIALDMGEDDVELRQFEVLTVPDSCGLYVDDFELVNYGDESGDCYLDVSERDGVKVLSIINPNIEETDDVDYVVMDEPDSKSTTPDKSAFYAYKVASGDTPEIIGTVWSNDEKVQDCYDYLIPEGYKIQVPVNWSFCFTQTGLSDQDGVYFHGKSLTIANGGALQVTTHVTDAAYNVYDITIEDLRMKSGSQISEDGGWQGGIRRFRAGKITISGSKGNPAAIWAGQTYGETTDPAKGADFVFNCDFAGTGYLRLSGGGKNEANRDSAHQFEINGVNEEFGGKMLVGGTDYLKFGEYTGSRGNIDLYFAKGLVNGALIFDDDEPTLGVGAKAEGVDLIPFNRLELYGNRILVDTIVTNNAGKGFSVLGDYSQTGKVVLDVRNAEFKQKKISILVAPNIESLDDFEVVNNPNSEWTLMLEESETPIGMDEEGNNIWAKELYFYNENVKAYIFETELPADDMRFKPIAFEGGEKSIDPADYMFDPTILTLDQYRLVVKEGMEDPEDGMSKNCLCIENLACTNPEQYDVYMIADDDDTKSSLVLGDSWSDGQAPSEGFAYAAISSSYWYFRYNANNVAGYGTDSTEFAGDSLTIGGNASFFASQGKSMEFTFADLRLLDGVDCWHGYWSTADSTCTINGKVSIFGTKANPVEIMVSSANSHIIFNAKLVGGVTRGLKVCKVQSASADENLTLDLMGDNDDYLGTILVVDNSGLKVGDSGLKHGTVELNAASARLIAAGQDGNEIVVDKVVVNTDKATIEVPEGKILRVRTVEKAAGCEYVKTGGGILLIGDGPMPPVKQSGTIILFR